MRRRIAAMNQRRHCFSGSSWYMSVVDLFSVHYWVFLGIAVVLLVSSKDARLRNIILQF